MEIEKKKALLELIKECDDVDFLEKIIREKKRIIYYLRLKEETPYKTTSRKRVHR